MDEHGPDAPDAEPKPAVEEQELGWTWAIVEIMGMRRHVGRFIEVEMVGVKMIRVEVPINEAIATDGKPTEYKVTGWQTYFYPGSSIFGLTPTNERSAMIANRQHRAVSPVMIEDHYDDDNEYDNEE